MQINSLITAISFDKNDQQKSFKELNGISFAEFNKLDAKQQAKVESKQGYLLTGYTKNQDVSIWGKLMGYDPNFKVEQINDLKDLAV